MSAREGEWMTTTRNDKSEAIWDKAWWREQSSGEPLNYERESLFIIRVAPWAGKPKLTGKFSVRKEPDGFTKGNCKLPGETVPHIFDTLEEAQAVYDFIVDKE
jgi:hypothetical protein